MMQTPSLLLCLLSAALVMAQGAGAQTSATPERLSPQVLDVQVTHPVRAAYWLSLPKGYSVDPAQKWPLVIFLHGAGESGNDLEMLKKHGLPKLIAEGKEFPFVVVAPQAPDARKRWNVEVLNRLLDEVLARHNVDPDRVYLTGLSMGGFGTWAWATENPERFAAVAPIAGGGVAHYAARHMKNLPIWAFHGEKDTVVLPQETFNVVNALTRLGAPEVRLTVYPEAAHDAWTQAYDTQALYTWLLSHRRAGSKP